MIEYTITHTFDQFRLNFFQPQGSKKRKNANVKIVQSLHAICPWKGLEM